MGDAFIVAFGSAADAMSASVAAQRAMADISGRPMRRAHPRRRTRRHRLSARDGDYVALALHQAARVVGAANGGQVIASEDAVEAADAGGAVRFQLDSVRSACATSIGRSGWRRCVGEGQALDEPLTVRAIPAEGHNLVPALTSFVGRAADIDDIRRLARAGHVVTVVGPGGMGKTRLVVWATLASLAEQELRRANAVDAARHQREALRFATEAAMPQLIAGAFILAARLAEPAGSDEAALRLHALADAMLEEIGFTLFPSDQALSDEVLERIPAPVRRGALRRADHLGKTTGPADGDRARRGDLRDGRARG